MPLNSYENQIKRITSMEENLEDMTLQINNLKTTMGKELEQALNCGMAWESYTTYNDTYLRELFEKLDSISYRIQSRDKNYLEDVKNALIEAKNEV